MNMAPKLLPNVFQEIKLMFLKIYLVNERQKDRQTDTYAENDQKVKSYRNHIEASC